MTQRAWQSLTVAGVTYLCLLGCGDKSAIHKQVRDPLLISKKPVESRIEQPSANPPAYAELSPPPVPEAAIATAPVKPEALGVNGVEHAGAAPVKPPVNAAPAVRTRSGATPAQTVSREAKPEQE